MKRSLPKGIEPIETKFTGLSSMKWIVAIESPGGMDSQYINVVGIEGNVKEADVLVRVSISVQRHHDHDNSKESI